MARRRTDGAGRRTDGAERRTDGAGRRTGGAERRTDGAGRRTDRIPGAMGRASGWPTQAATTKRRLTPTHQASRRRDEVPVFTALQNGVAIEIGHHHVQKNQIGQVVRASLQKTQAGGAGIGLFHAMTEPLQAPAQ